MNRLGYSRLEHCPRCDNPHQCSKCSTEIDLDIRHMESGLAALILTKWINLGIGDTPLDPTW